MIFILAKLGWLAKEIGVEHDAVTRDFARLSFLVPESYFYFYNPNIFTDNAVTVLSNSDLASSPQPQSHDHQPRPHVVDGEKALTPNSSDSCNSCSSSIPQTDLEFRGIKYSEIVEELVARTGGEPYEGERNNRLYLICRLLANITDRQVDRLFKVCPRFGLAEAEVRACCESACKSARTEKLPYVLYKVLRDFGIDPNNPNSVRKDEEDDDDHARDQFMRRAALIGFRAGMVASFLWGRLNKDRKEYTIEFALWVANFILQSLLDRYSTNVNEQALS